MARQQRRGFGALGLALGALAMERTTARRQRRHVGALALGALALTFTLAAPVEAFVPPAEKIATRVARANRAAGRTVPLVLSVALQGEDGRTLARGELRTDPRGLARLELSGGGLSERHLLRGGERMAARGGGEPIADPAPYLPPLFLLQAGDGDRLLSGVLSAGGAPGDTVLGRHEGDVCWVLGGRDLPPPANPSAATFGSVGPKASVWVRREDFRIVRIDQPDGTRYRLGPPVVREGVTLPEWVRIERPGMQTLRLEIQDVRTGRFDLATTFGTDWLRGR